MTADSDAYEVLTMDLFERLSNARGVELVRLERDVLVPGISTTWQTDVLWQYRDPAVEGIQSVLIECRHYGSNLKKTHVLALKGVIDEVGAYAGPDRIENATGALVTLTGYQSGALDVARTWGVQVLELREPTDNDFAGRVKKIEIRTRMRHCSVNDLQLGVVGPVAAHTTASGAFLSDQVEVELQDGTRTSLVERLAEGELAPLDCPPGPARRLAKTFSPPVALVIGGTVVGQLAQASGMLFESDAEHEQSLGGRERVAQTLRNALTDERVWFASGERVWETK